MRFAPAVCLLIAVGAFLGSCTPPPSPVSVRAKKALNGPPDLVKNGKWDERWRAFQLHSFQLNHIWAGAGRRDSSTSVAYRTKVTVWDYNGDDPVAELYFHDGSDAPSNPDPNVGTTKRPYQLNFPLSAAAAILQSLRNANEPVYLYYYQNEWAVGIGDPEAVGVD